MFNVCKSVHHRTIQINHQPEANNFPVYYPDVCRSQWPRGLRRRSAVGRLLRSRVRTFMQEVIHPSLDKLNGYTVHYNIGSSQRGTAIVARDNIELANITRIPSGRAIAAEFKGIWLINIYAPSGAAKRNDREQFFNTEHPYILRAAPENIILRGNFNCVLEKNDTTSHFNYIRSLAQLIQGLTLRDAWETNPAIHAYTHYSSTGATRIDRLIYHTHCTRRKPVY
jgi:exonuclease III